MKCEQIRDRMLDVAAGLSELTADENQHVTGCSACAAELKSMHATMSLLDEWQAPEPSPYFDVRLQARLREETAKQPTGWMQWFRRPALAAALTVLMGVGIGILFTRTHGDPPHDTAVVAVPAPPGSAVSDLQTLEKNHEIYQDFELLDDLDVQQNVTANP